MAARRASKNMRPVRGRPKGTMVLPHFSRPLLYPDKKFKNFKYPDVVAGDHWGQFVQACLGHATTCANFGYAGPLTEAVLLGCLSTRFPETTLEWDADKLTLTNSKDATEFVRRKYRKGWEVKGL